MADYEDDDDSEEDRGRFLRAPSVWLRSTKSAVSFKLHLRSLVEFSCLALLSATLDGVRRIFWWQLLEAAESVE